MLEVLLAAAHRAAPTAPRAAVQWCEAALRLLDPADDDRRGRILAELGRLLSAVGDLPAARERLREGLALDPPDALRVALATTCAAVENLLGEHDTAHARLHRTYAELSDSGSVPAATLRVQLALDALHEHDHTEAHRFATEASDAAASLDAPELDAAAGALVAYARCWVDPSTADLAVADGAALLDRLSEDQLSGTFDAVFYLGHAELQREAFVDARRHLRRGVDVALATERVQLLVPMLAALGHVLLTLGEVAEATRVSERAVEVAGAVGAPFLLSWSSAFRARVAVAAGDTATATTSVETALSGLRPGDPATMRAAVNALVGLHWADVGEPDRCVAAMTAAGAPGLPLIDPSNRCTLYEVLTRAELARGDGAAASRWADRATQLATSLDLPVARGLAQRARAALLLHEGSPVEAAETALAAAASVTSGGAVLEEARCRILAGRAFGAAGQPERRRRCLRDAAATLERCGAHGYGRECREELRAPVQDAAVVDLLAPRERQTAELVAIGLTNRALARELGLSEKTVEATLTRIFVKLGITSRAALAALIARSGGRGDW